MKVVIHLVIHNPVVGYPELSTNLSTLGICRTTD